MGREVILDQDECVGCETCVEICPGVFAYNESENKAYVINPDGASKEEIEEAIDACPANCITMSED